MSKLPRATRDPDWAEIDAFQRNTKNERIQKFLSLFSIGRSGTAKLLKYNAHELMRYGAFLTMFTKGTVFTTDINFWLNAGGYLMMCGATALVLYLVGEYHDPDHREGLKLLKDCAPSLTSSSAETAFCHEYTILEAITPMTKNLQKVTPFIFGLFTSLTINRWWSLRIQSLGTVMDAVTYNVAFLAGHTHRKVLPEEEQKAIDMDIFKICKLGVASLQILCMVSREKFDYTSLIDDELLTEEEVAIVKGCPSAAQVIWSFICSLGGNVLDRLKVPPPNHNPFYSEVQGASNAITQIEAYHDSQLPFPYVHMIVMLVQMNNVVLSVVDGMYIALAIREQVWTVVLIRLAHLVVVTSMYQALLQVCFLIEDPLGEDVTDFPIVQFQLRIYNESKRVLVATKQFWDHRRSLSPAPAAAPAPAPAPAPKVEAKPSAIKPGPEADLRKRVEEEVAKRFEADMAKHLLEVSQSVDEVTRRVDAVSRRLVSPAA